MAISEDDYLKALIASNGDIVAHKLSPSSATDDYGVALETTDEEVVLMKVSPATVEDDYGFSRNCSDGEVAILKGSGLVDVCTVYFSATAIKWGEGDDSNATPATATANALAELKTQVSWNTSAIVSLMTDSWNSPNYVSERKVMSSASQQLSQAQVDCITGEATTARVELIAIDQTAPSDTRGVGDATSQEIRVNLSTSVTQYSGPDTLYAATPEGSVTGTSLGSWVSVGGSDYDRGLYTYEGIDISQFSSVTTSSVIVLWGGINSATIAPGLVQRPSEPYRNSIECIKYGSNFNGDRWPENSDPDLYTKIVFQKPE